MTITGTIEQATSDAYLYSDCLTGDIVFRSIDSNNFLFGFASNVPSSFGVTRDNGTFVNGSSNRSAMLNLHRAQGNNASLISGDTIGELNFRCRYGTSGVAPMASISGIYSGTGTTKSGDIVFSTESNNSGLTERIRLTSSGNLGIGTSAPTQPLEIVGNANFLGTTFQNGRIGVKTPLPAAHLHIKNASLTERTISVLSYNNINKYFDYDTLYAKYGSSNYMYFDTQRAMCRILMSGASNTQVRGISLQYTTNYTTWTTVTDNTTMSNALGLFRYTLSTPGGEVSIWELEGSIYDSLLVSDYTGVNHSLCASSNGNVGIGTLNPQAKLDVAGTVRVQGNIDCSGGNIAAGNLGIFRNRLINGDMRIAQRGTSTVSSTGTGLIYCVDRTGVAYSITTGGITQTQQTLGTTESPFASGFRNSLRITASTANTNYLWINPSQYIEGNNISDLAWGTLSGKTIMLSFWIKSNIATNSTVCFSLRNSALTHSYVVPFTITSSGNWQFVSATIPSPPNGSTWNVDNTIGLIVCIAPYEVGAMTSTYGSWVSGNKTTATSSVNIWGSLNNYIELTGVQLEKGSIVTPYEFRLIATELQLCQRYFYQLGGATNTFCASGYCRSSNLFLFSYQFPVAMRSTATPVLSTSSSNFNISCGSNDTIPNALVSPSNWLQNMQTGFYGLTPSSNQVVGQAGHVSVLNGPAYIMFNAEL